MNLDVQLSGQNSEGTELEWIGVVRDLAMRGAMIETHARVKKGDKLKLSLTLPNRTDLLELPAVAVRWARGRRLGVEFLKMDAETKRQLMRYLSGVHSTARAQRKAA